MVDLFDAAAPASPAAEQAQLRSAVECERILVFDVAVRGSRETVWHDLFKGYRALRAITFSASVPAILDVAQLFEDVEITFGSERVLSRELAALVQGTTAAGYRFHGCACRPKSLHRALRASGPFAVRRAAAQAGAEWHSSIPAAA